MAIDNQTVKRVAFLSRLKVEDSRLEETQQEFNKILNWIEQLNEVDTATVEPLVSVNEDALPLREDVVNDGNLKNEVLQNAPMQEYGYFAVPKVVE
jgi:aspartyl-tRNA(Asn)/glutamyl-tRNA(Gln) amidotransferase subunit C